MCIYQLFSVWTRLPLDAFRLEKVMGGLSNEVFVVTMTDTSTSFPEKMILRVYGKESEAWMNRALELDVIRVASSVGLAPYVLKCWRGGRLESFVPGRTLTPWKDLYDIRVLSRLATRVATLHRCPLPSASRNTSRLERWIKDWGERARAVHPEWVDRAIQGYRAWTSPSDTLVLCHNDLNVSNLLWEEETGNIHLIDYEYAGWNYRGYDLANLYCEVYMHNATENWPHFKCESVTKGWTKKHFRYFCREYIRVYTQQEDVSDADIELLQSEVKQFEPLSHLVWGLWGLMQSRNTDVSFGYVEYGLCRLRHSIALFNGINK